MGLWSKIKKGIKKAANTVKDFVNDVADAVGNAVESVGDGINDALNWIGDKIGVKQFFSWFGGILKGVFALVASVIKGVIGIVGGIVSGLIKIIGGILTLQGGVILDGIWDIFSPILGTIIVVLGKLISLVQSIFYLQGFERPLTEKEKAELKKVFKDSLNYYVIRIIEGHAGIYGVSSRAFTLANTIYMKTDSIGDDLLVHEVTHVWQYQNSNTRYASDALTAQWFVDDAYNWEKEINDRNKTNWVEFNKEAQAEFLEDTWNLGELRNSSGIRLAKGNGSFFTSDKVKTFEHLEVGGKDYTNIAIKATLTVRNEWF